MGTHNIALQKSKNKVNYFKQAWIHGCLIPHIFGKICGDKPYTAESKSLIFVVLKRFLSKEREFFSIMRYCPKYYVDHFTYRSII